ncbi:MAG: hypothetical protein ACYDAN_02545 [Candidatus Limnocylindrales bacterium]
MGAALNTMDDNWAKVLLALIGAASGILGTVVAQALLGRRERSTRWLAARREIYASFNAAARVLQDAAAARLDDHGQLLGEYPELEAAPMIASYEEVRLIAPPRVRDAAAMVFAKVRVLASVSSGDPDDLLADFRTSALGDLGPAWGDLFAEMRDDLGIPGARSSD